MADFEEKMLESFEKKQMIWWRYIDDIFFIWEYGEESLKVFIEQVNMFHSTIKFTAENSKEEVNFLNVNVKLIVGELKTDLFIKPTDTHQFLDSTSCIRTTAKREYLTVKLSGLTEFVQITRPLIDVVMI